MRMAQFSALVENNMTQEDSQITKQLSILGKNGIIIVFVGLLVLAGLAMYLNFSSNQETKEVIRDNTEVMAQVKDILKDLRGSLSIKVK